MFATPPDGASRRCEELLAPGSVDSKLEAPIVEA
jgi:hypothetical protein